MSGFMLLVQNNIGLAYELKKMLDPDGDPIPSFISGDSVTGKNGFTIDIVDKENEKIKNESLHISATKGCKLVYQLLYDEDSEVLKDTRGNLCRAAVQFRFDNLPIDINGDSSDLFFSLSIITEAFPEETSDSHFAATGGLEPATGAVQYVNHIPAKFEAACEALKNLNGEKFFFYPQSNEKDITLAIKENAKELNITLQPLNFWIDALQLLRMPLDLFTGNPYVGRSSFKIEDYKRFCGRDEEIRGLRTKLEKSTALLIIGGSGSGRTSLVQAGLIPDLKSHQLNGMDMADHRIFRPKDLFPDLSVEPTVSQLFDALKKTLQGDWSQATEIDTQQTPGPAQFAELAASWRPPKFASEGYWLWAIDSLEEIFSYPQAVVEGIAAFFAAIPDQPDLRIVVTLRHDYREELITIFNNRQEYTLPPMTGAQLVAMIKTPTERSRCPPVVFEVKEGKSLADELRDDIAVPEAMPWLQRALATLYERAYARYQQLGDNPNGKQSTIEIRFEDYEAIGKIQGFILQEANKFVQSLADELQNALPILVDHLIKVEHGQVKRKKHRWPLDNYINQSIVSLANELINLRLLTISSSIDNVISVSLIHDCLLTESSPFADFIYTEKKRLIETEKLLIESMIGL